MTEQNSKPSFARWTILSVTTLSAFMASLDTNIVTIALPKISHDLSSGVSLLGWVITGYILATAMLLLQSGKIGDRYGKKRVYLYGFAIFGASSALCGISQSIYQLIGFRILQGVGSSVLTATTMPLIFDSFPPKERGSAVGVNSIAWAVGAVAGPVLGGFLVAVDWRFVFYINVPIAAVAVLVGSKRIPNTLNKTVTNTGGSFINEINPLSSIFLPISVAMILLWLTFFTYQFAIIAVAALIVLALNERRSKNPLLNRELRSNRGFVYSIIGLAVLQIAFLGIPFLMSFYFQSIEGLSAILAGLSIAPLPFALVLLNPVSGRLFDKLKTPAILSIAGALLEGIATIFLSIQVKDGSAPLYVGLVLVLIGAASGLVWTPMISTVLKFSKPELRGVANGTAFTLMNIGFATSIAISVAMSATFLPTSVISQIFLGNLSNLTEIQAKLFGEGISRALLTLGLINFVAMPILYFVLREQKKKF